eukprot:TRINITY_DN206_c0_g2_i1.p1 TRINITY_DN206_c0_g2~~TRINITY_DN206_c0_g2_i1.p1  ORF type:complete len:980 (+),score=360.30 TRINITY_DN206_c0_g2_i1:1404-4343(+)
MDIALKIRLISQGRLVTFRFKLHGTVSDTLQMIQEKVRSDDPNKLLHYGLFQRGNKFRNNRWLDGRKTLSYYDLKPGDVLDFRTKQTLIKIQFLGPWTTVKTLIVDESKTVAELSREIGEKLEVRNPEEFSLQIQREVNGELTGGVWLNPNRSLAEQNVETLNATLLLRKKFFFHDVNMNQLENNESLTRHFWQILDAVVAGTTICTIHEAITFAAIQCQIRFGDCTCTLESFLETDHEEYLPPDYVPLFRKINSEIHKQYKGLAGINSINAKYRYLLHARALKTYGYTFFKVEKILSERDNPHRIFLGISRDRIIHVDADSKEVLWSCSLYQVAQWKAVNQNLFIDFIDFAEHYTTQDVEAVTQTLWEYASLHSNRLRSSRESTSDSVIPGSPPTSRPQSPPIVEKSVDNSAEKEEFMGASIEVSEVSHNSNQVVGMFSTSTCGPYAPLLLSPTPPIQIPSDSRFPSRNSSTIFASNSTSSSNMNANIVNSPSSESLLPSPPLSRKDSGKRTYYAAVGATAIAVLNPNSNHLLDSRPPSPPNCLTLKQREASLKRQSSRKSSILSESYEELNAFEKSNNNSTRRSPLYEDPNRIHINPLFEGGVSVPYHPSDEFNYCLKMIRCLSCLLTSLRNQKKASEIRVKFPDKSIKTIEVDGNKTVSDLAVEIGEKVGIRNPEEFSLQSDEESDTWLNPYQTLWSQGITENDLVVFKKKFHYNDAFITQNDPVYFNLLFCQCRDAIRSGTYTCNLDEAVQLAATNLQISFGDYNATIHQPGFLKFSDLQFFLPTDYLEFWGVTFQRLEKMIYKEHQKLRGIKEEFAKYRYLQLCRNLRTYGTVFFQVKVTAHTGKAHPKIPMDTIFLGFSRDSVSFVTSKAKKVLHEYPLNHLRSWEGTSQQLKLDFGDHPEGSFLFETLEGGVISKYLSDYVDFIQKTWMATQTFNPQIFKYPPEEFNGLRFADSFCWENGKRVFTSSFFTNY